MRRFVLALSFVSACPLLAQVEPTPRYTEEIEIRVIDVDVVVTNRKGDLLTDLSREQFELYEDGKRVEVEYFSRVVGGQLQDLPPPDPDEGGDADGTTMPDPIPRTWVIFIDHTNMAPPIRNHAMRQLQLFLFRSIAQGDRGVIALNDGRSFRIRQGLTDDTKLLMNTLAKMEKERMSVSPTKMRTNSLLSQMRRSEEEMGAMPTSGRFIARDETEYMAQTSGGEITALIQQEAARTKAAILSMNALLDSLAQMEGRLALVYLGAGFNTLPAADLAQVWRTRYVDHVGTSIEPRPEEQREAIEREITRLYDNLSALRVTVYTVHGSDPGGGPTSVEDSGQLETHVASSTDIVSLTEAGTTREMADRTGGLHFKVNPRLAGQLDAVVRDLDNYYSLGYRPTGDPGRARRIRVKVNVDGARVRHRDRVRERTRSEKATGVAVASMVQPSQTPPRARRVEVPLPAPASAEANPLGVVVEAERPRKLGSQGEHFLSFDFSINLESLTFVESSDGRRAEFLMHFALVGGDGAVYPLESREQELTIPRGEIPTATDQLVAWSWHLNVTPLKIPAGVPARQRGMRLAVTVEDLNSGTRSLVTVPLGG